MDDGLSIVSITYMYVISPVTGHSHPVSGPSIARALHSDRGFHLSRLFLKKKPRQNFEIRLRDRIKFAKPQPNAKFPLNYKKWIMTDLVFSACEFQ